MGGRLRHGEIRAIGAPRRTDRYVHARGHQGSIEHMQVAGVAANTDIAVGGLSVSGELLHVLSLNGVGSAPNDIAGNCSITAEDTIRCTEATTGRTLIVIWRNDPPESNS